MTKQIKKPVGRPAGPVKKYIGFKVEPRLHEKLKILVKAFVKQNTP